jgi:hypothetical protein
MEQFARKDSHTFRDKWHTRQIWSAEWNISLAGDLYGAFHFGIPAVNKYLQIRSKEIDSKTIGDIFEDRHGSCCFYKLYHNNCFKLDSETAHDRIEFALSDDRLAACLCRERYAQY